MMHAHRFVLVALAAGVLGLSTASASVRSLPRLAFAPDSSWTAEGDRIGARFGSALAPAGDVNGDGYSDLLIGAPGVLSGRGQALIYLSGPDGLSPTAAWFVQGPLGGTDLGRSVAPVGDVNGDGFADFVVGASHWADQSDDAGGAFLYLGSASTPSTQAAWIAEGDQAESGFGASVADAGDVNGDGFRDLLIGAPNFDGVATDTGRALLFLGNGSSYASTPAWQVESDEQGGALGTIVTGAFDLNADGFDDVAVSAPGATNGGSLLVYLGSASGLASTPSSEITRLDPGFARAIAALGDVNGDGYADLAVGAPDFSGGEANEGSVWIFLGGAGGVDTTPDWQAQGDEVDAHFGASLATSGDVNGDGFADLCVGSAARGRAWLYLGGASGPAAQADWIAEEDGAGSGFGGAVSGAGDLNADGFTDFVVGAPDLDNGQTNEGRVHAYLGHGEGPAAAAVSSVNAPAADALGAALAGEGDVNGDGLSDLVVGAPGASTPEAQAGRVLLYLSGATTPSWSYDSHVAGAGLGSAVANAGDVNGDGFADFLAAAPNQTVGGAQNAGMVFLFMGKPNGPANTPAWSASGAAVGQQLGRSLCCAGDVNGDGFADFAMSSGGSTAHVYLGSASGARTDVDWTTSIPESGDWRDLLVIGAGDVNRDGLSDLLLVARRYQSGAPEAGGAFLYLGSNAGLGVSPWWSVVRAEASFGASAAPAGDLDGDGFADFVIGSPDADSGAGAVSFFFGSDLTVQEPWADLPGQAGEELGDKLARVGDTDGDGTTDLAIAAPGIAAVHLLLGSASGPAVSSTWSGPPGTGFGAALASAGDVNGDGFADLAIGSAAASGFALQLGNARDLGHPGRALLARQAKRSGARLSPLGRSDSETSIRLLARGRSAAGRRLLRLEWNIDYLSVVLPQAPLAHSAWARSGVPVAGQGSTRDWNQVVSGLAIGSNYHWKLRIASDTAFFPSTPWATLAPAAPNELHCRTRGQFSTIGVDEVGTTPRSWLTLAPNPARDRLTLRFALPAFDGATLALFDAGGRLRRTWAFDRDPVRAGELEWDGRDGEGRSLPAGVYFFELRAGDARTTARVVWESR